MGYTTEFTGRFLINRTLDMELADYIRRFSLIRHMKRDNEKLKELNPDWERYCFRRRLGTNGEYYAKDDGMFGQLKTEDILNYNYPPSTQPGLWCHWTIGDDNASIVWDNTEKFYDYKEWLEYLIENFLKPNGYHVNGSVGFQGEFAEDKGFLIAEEDKVRIEIIEGDGIPF